MSEKSHQNLIIKYLKILESNIKFSRSFVLTKVGTTTWIEILTQISKINTKLKSEIINKVKSLKSQHQGTRKYLKSEIFTLIKGQSMKWNQSLKFVFVRHPFDRLASGFYDKIDSLERVRNGKKKKYWLYKNQATKRFQ